jgi:hypothetical protein
MRSAIVGVLLCGMSSVALAAPTALWIRPISLDGPRVLFSDELLPVEETLAELFSRPRLGGYKVIPPAELHAMWRGVQRGHLPGVSDVCANPPPPSELTEQLNPNAAQADADITCNGESCKLVVRISAASKAFAHTAGTELARYQATLPTYESPAEWALRLKRDGLAPLDKQAVESDTGGIAVGGDQKIVGDLHQSGAWSPALKVRAFQGAFGRLTQCQRQEPADHDWWMRGFVIEVDAAGTVSRCDSQYPERLLPPAFDCQCKVLAAIELGAGAAGRRASFNVRVPSGASSRATSYEMYFEPESATDATAMLSRDRAISHGDLEACIVGLPKLGELSIPAELTAARDGRLTSAKLTWAKAIPQPVRACVEKTLLGARVNCPLSGASEIRGKLMLIIN